MKLHFLVSNQTNPYLNIAVENHLVATSLDDTVVLYLWRNRRTVVIGQNQNPYSEADLDALHADGGYLMRRRTGGGAVYHDEGNLNFSFIAPAVLYDQMRQFGVLQRAVATFGLQTQVSGRNDVLVRTPDAGADGQPEWRKFSGNAFSRGQHNHLHHGTILIHTRMEELQRYLRPHPAKLRKHGVSSVQSRVANLGDLCPDITADSLQPRLLAAFEQEYGGTAQLLDFDQMAASPEVTALRDEFASDRWRLGNWLSFSAQRAAQFDWGGVEVSLAVADGIIADVQIASDAIDLQVIDELHRLLVGHPADRRPVSTNPMVADVLALLFD